MSAKKKLPTFKKFDPKVIDDNKMRHYLGELIDEKHMDHVEDFMTTYVNIMADDHGEDFCGCRSVYRYILYNYFQGPNVETFRHMWHCLTYEFNLERESWITYFDCGVEGFSAFQSMLRYHLIDDGSINLWFHYSDIRFGENGLFLDNEVFGKKYSKHREVRDKVRAHPDLINLHGEMYVPENIGDMGKPVFGVNRDGGKCLRGKDMIEIMEKEFKNQIANERYRLKHFGDE